MQANSDTQSNEAENKEVVTSPQRKLYRTPRLKSEGSIEELTAGAGVVDTDGLGGSGP